MKIFNLSFIIIISIFFSACSVRQIPAKSISKEISFTIPFPIEVKPESVNNFDKYRTTFLGKSTSSDISIGGTLYQSGIDIQGTVNFVITANYKIYPLSQVYDCKTKSKNLKSILVEKNEIENMYILPQGKYCTKIKIPLKER